MCHRYTCFNCIFRWSPCGIGGIHVSPCGMGGIHVNPCEFSRWNPGGVHVTNVTPCHVFVTKTWENVTFCHIFVTCYHGLHLDSMGEGKVHHLDGINWDDINVGRGGKIGGSRLGWEIWRWLGRFLACFLTLLMFALVNVGINLYDDIFPSMWWLIMLMRLSLMAGLRPFMKREISVCSVMSRWDEISTSGKSLFDAGFPRIKGHFPGYLRHAEVTLRSSGVTWSHLGCLPHFHHANHTILINQLVMFLINTYFSRFKDLLSSSLLI